MTMKITDPSDPDKEIEVFTPEEMAAKEAEIKAKEDALAAASADLEKERRVSAEKSDNIKRLRDMTEEEKSKMTQEQINAQKLAEQAADEAKQAREELAKERADKETAQKEVLISRFAGQDPELRKKLEDNFNIIDSGKEPDMGKRMAAAAAMSGIQVNPQNPLTQEFFGSAPTTKQQTEKQEFLKSDKAAAAFAAMGVSTEEKK